MPDLINDVWDVEASLHSLRRLMHQGSILTVNLYSRVWELQLNVSRGLGLAEPLLDQNWLTADDVTNLMRLADLDLTRHWKRSCCRSKFRHSMSC